MARTRRVAVDQDGDWIYHIDFVDQNGNAPPPGEDFVVLSQEDDYSGGLIPLWVSQTQAYTDITVWGNGLISFGVPTQAQMDFMATAGSGTSPSGFPGDYIDGNFPSDSSIFTIGLKDGFWTVEWDFGGTVVVTPDTLSFSGDPNNVPNGFRIGDTEVIGAPGENGTYFLADLIQLHGTAAANTMTGTAAPETLFGEGGNDVIRGNDGGDRLVGGAGNDRLEGGLGGDRLDGGSGDDVLDPGRGANDIDGGTGIDRVILDYSFYGIDIDFTLPADGEILGGNSIRNVEALEIRTSSGQDVIHGGAYADKLSGGSGWDKLYGGAGNDVLDAGAGGPQVGPSSYGGSDFFDNPTWLDGRFLLSNDGNIESATAIPHVTVGDTITGAEFVHDRYYAITVTDPNAQLIVDVDGLFQGTSWISLLDESGNEIAFGHDGDYDPGTNNLNDDYLNYQFTQAGTYIIKITAEMDNFERREDYVVNFSLSSAPVLYGNILEGGTGDDIFYVYSDNDEVIEKAGEGNDTVYSAATFFTLAGQYIETLILTGSAERGYGNSQVNTLIGNAGANTLDGGGGADTMKGGAGDDKYYVDDAGDRVFENAGEGVDSVESKVSFTLAGQYLENLRLTGTAATNATGNGLDNQLTGNNAANLLNGGAGADKMQGMGGNDRYIVDNLGDVVLEADGGGTDVVESSVSFSLAGQFVENLRLTGSGAINGTGNGLANIITGNGNANVLNGGGGADQLSGGTGDDRYVVDNAGDKVTELDGQGSDTVDSAVSFSLAGQYVEVLNLTGAAAISGTGNGLDNRITGNAAANTLNGGAGSDRLDGGAGADKLIGGIGNDVYVVDNAADQIVELADQGADTVEASISFSLAGQYVETLRLTGTANLNGTGNGQANSLYGNTGNNVLNGGGGADNLFGGAGNDRYVVDNTGDKVTELAGEGTDVVESSVTFSIAGQYVEELRLTGSAAINGTGNSLANVLTGNSAANVLSGGTGDDALHGGLGTDTLAGGAGLDSFFFETALGAANVDSISDFKSADDTIVLDRSVFSGVADGVLAAGAFRLGTAAADADDRVLYDKASGQIFYDADGAGGAAAVLFAQVTAGTVLVAGDFFGVA